MSAQTDADTDDATPDTDLVLGETGGEAYTLPVEDTLTGRAFVTGKSGSGKSNTGSVVAEELLDRGHPLLIVDVDGEYWGLKEQYEILHVGATEECDLQVGPEHAAKLAELALDQHVPIVLDVSGYLDGDTGDAVVRETARELFAREQQAMQPFLLLVEEIHEYLPQQASRGETGDVLTKIAKRGRKRGLGIMGLSQRPADVDKAFITQADLLVWHRLTWDNDTDVVARVIDRDHADAVGGLADGEAFVQADWDESPVERVQVRRKATFDAGATPGLDDVERPDLKSIGDDLVSELEEISAAHEQRQDRIAQLEADLNAKEERIAELEAELEDAKDLEHLGEAFLSAVQGDSDGGDAVGVDQDLLDEKNATIRELRDENESLAEQVETLEAERDDLRDEVERLRSYEERVEQAERIEEQLAEAREVLGVDVADTDGERVAKLESKVSELEAENERLREQGGDVVEPLQDYEAFLDDEAVTEAIEGAKAECSASERYVTGVLAAIINEGGWVSYDTIAERLGVSTTTDVSKAASELERRKVVRKDKRDGEMHVDLNTEGLQQVREAAREREKTEELMEEL